MCLAYDVNHHVRSLFYSSLFDRRTSGCTSPMIICHYCYSFYSLPGDFLDIYVHRRYTKIIDSKQLCSMCIHTQQILVYHRRASVPVVHDGIISLRRAVRTSSLDSDDDDILPSLRTHIFQTREREACMSLLMFQKSKFAFVFFRCLRDSCWTNGENERCLPLSFVSSHSIKMRQGSRRHRVTCAIGDRAPFFSSSSSPALCEEEKAEREKKKKKATPLVEWLFTSTNEPEPCPWVRVVYHTGELD